MVVEADERRVLALVGVGRAMSSTADYEQALATLIQTISELLDAESAGFMLYDPERSELVLQQPAFGIDDPETIAAYHVSLREGGNAVRVFLSRSPYMSNDAERDPRLIRRFVRLFHTRNTISVPLVVEDQAIGVCHAINKRGGPFTDEDLKLLDLVARCWLSASSPRACSGTSASSAAAGARHLPPAGAVLDGLRGPRDGPDGRTPGHARRPAGDGPRPGAAPAGHRRLARAAAATRGLARRRAG